MGVTLASETEIPLESLQGRRLGRSELIQFTNQLAVMLASGVVLTDAIDAISEKTRPGNCKMILEDISRRIKSGESFSSALSAYPMVFDSMYISMVKASEAAGKMPEMLEVLGSYLNAEADTRKQVKSALIYPFIMVLMAIAATGTLMFFVLPRFMRIYESRGAELPALTQVLVRISGFIGDQHAMTMLLTGVFAAYVLMSLWTKSSSGRRIFDYLKIRTPVLGTMFIDTIMTRSTRIMATMLNTGVSLLDALKVIEESCSNSLFQSLWRQTDERIRSGYQLSEAITVSTYGSLVDPGVIQMLRAGEKGGRLGIVCDKISLYYEKKLQNSIRNVTTLIEPLMIVIMGSIIGTIAIALLLPVFRISTVISQ